MTTLQLHIFTSPKGGVGKTVLAKALLEGTAKYFRKSLGPGLPGALPIVGLDLNPMNYDLYREIRRTRGTSTEEKVAFSHPETGKEASLFRLNLQPQLGHIYRREEGFQLFGGIHEFWSRIVSVTYEHRPSRKANLESTLILVIDTNFHAASLVHSLHQEDPALNAEIDCLKKHYDDVTVYIWFVWTIAAIHNGEDGPSIGLALQQLEGFGIKICMMHLINPVAYLPPRTVSELLSGLWRSENQYYSIEPLCRLATAETSDNTIGLSDFLELAKRNLLRPSPGRSDLDVLFGKFSSTIIQSTKGRPWNVIPIPYFFPHLHGAVEGIGGGNQPLVDRAYSDLASLLVAYLTNRGSPIQLPKPC